MTWPHWTPSQKSTDTRVVPGFIARVPKPPSINEVRGRHWATTKKRLHPFYWAAVSSARRLKWDRGLVPCEVRVTLEFPERRRRDPHNYTGTVVKSAIDGLVAAGVWPDDTPEWVKVAEPVIKVYPQSRRKGVPGIYLMTVELRPLEGEQLLREKE